MQSFATTEQCLDFINTVRWHASVQPEDTLHKYDDVLRWAQHLGIIVPKEAQQLAEYAQAQPDEAATVLGRVIDVREALYRVLVAYMHGDPTRNEDIALINYELAAALCFARVVAASEGYTLAWTHEAARLDTLLWPLLRGAVDLLTTPERLARVGQCADDRGCGWLFLDTSKNHSRRWCDINDCGNRAKQRRHYARTRSGTPLASRAGETSVGRKQ